MGTKILVVDDEMNICEMVRTYFENEGYEVKTASDGAEGVSYFKMYEPDLVLLDVMMPKKDGWQVCREIREVSSKPIIMVTAKDDVFDKVLGLELGADDYVTKPFENKELVARVKAVLRRFTDKTESSESDDDTLTFPGLSVSLSRYEVTYEGNLIEMPPKELEVLYCLASNVNKVLTREQLLEHVWGITFYGDSRTVDVHIKRLREKLVGSEKYGWEIGTIWSVGYKFSYKPNKN